MLKIESKFTQPGEVSPAVTLDERTVYGLQFDVVYDPAALEYIEWQSGISGAVINPEPGRFNYIVSRDASQEPLPVDIGSLVFEASGSSQLILADVVAGDEFAQAVPLQLQHGFIEVTGVGMNFEAYWDAPASSFGVVHTRVFVGESADINDGTFQQVAAVAVPATAAPFSLGANIGTRYAYAVHVDGEGDVGPASMVVPFSTDLALPAPAGFGVRVV